MFIHVARGFKVIHMRRKQTGAKSSKNQSAEQNLAGGPVYVFCKPVLHSSLADHMELLETGLESANCKSI